MNYGKQTVFKEETMEALERVVDSTHLTQGREVEAFERELAEYCGARFAVACSSGTAALWCAYKATGLLPIHVVLVPTITFVATANMADSLLAGVRFADVTRSGHLDASKDYHDPTLVVPVHMAGDSCDMERVWRKWGKASVIVEDACHALGASYKGTKVGACEYSDMCCFSFHPVKSITTGEGGAVTTNNRHLYELLLQARNHGFLPGTHKQTDLGFNFRMDEMSGALGRVQLRHLDEMIERRREIAKKYVRALDGLVEVPIVDGEGAHHLFVVRTPKRNQLKEHLVSKGINPQIHYRPVHTQPFWDDYGDVLPAAEAYYDEALSLPIYPSMSEDDVERVIYSVEEALA